VTELHLRVLATDAVVTALSPAALVPVAEDWSRCLTAPSDGQRVDLSEDGADPAASRTAPLTARLTRAGIAGLAGRSVLLHACGLSDEAGHTLVLVAPSGTGKSTAAAVLARERFGYVSDECVAIEPDGRVLPFPKPLSLALDAGIGEVQVGPDALGLRRCPDTLTLGAVVLLDRAPERESARLDRVALADALLALVPQTSALTDLQRPLVLLCATLDRVGGAWRLHYGEIEHAADHLAALLDPASPHPEPWHPVETGRGDDVAWALRDGRLRRRPVRDGVRVGAEVVLLVDDRPVRLSPIGATIWRACARPMTLAALVDVVLAEHGDHPDAEAWVHQAVDALVDARVLAAAPPVPAEALLAAEEQR
jgi:hypothetical protein